ncbi:MAG: NAD(P)-binding domain-containing protein, partial [Verrucomicrobiae bacterium]|nr:NAD(P)-binding domain-containing protein [Verrucomicrobiae bacterium]NNJ86543.1 NAD(P)-binding domain-containing protein [Akkermansiaceae bacterium]
MDSKLLPRIGVIGTGAIAEALVIGMIDHSRCSGPIRVSIRNEQRSSRLADRFENVVVDPSNQSIIDQTDIIIFAVLPDQAVALLNELTFRDDQTLINLVAGFSVSELRKIVSPLSRVHRLIPLPPVEFGLGPLPMFPPCEDLANLFSGCGKVIQVEDETDFTGFAAVSGLMATHHRLTATVTQWVASRGVNADNAAAYTSHMFHALTYLESTASGADLQRLARKCVTQGGINELALDQLEELQWFDQVVERLDTIADRLEKIVETGNP